MQLVLSKLYFSLVAQPVGGTTAQALHQDCFNFIVEMLEETETMLVYLQHL